MHRGIRGDSALPGPRGWGSRRARYHRRRPAAVAPGDRPGSDGRRPERAAAGRIPSRDRVDPRPLRPRPRLLHRHRMGAGRRHEAGGHRGAIPPRTGPSPRQCSPGPVSASACSGCHAARAGRVRGNARGILLRPGPFAARIPAGAPASPQARGPCGRAPRRGSVPLRPGRTATDAIPKEGQVPQGMRIGILSSPFVDTPPPTTQFAGLERGVPDLANTFVRRGHHVHLFAVGTFGGGGVLRAGGGSPDRGGPSTGTARRTSGA